jgi:threonine/homoserine/homoserine lactone efflux protein
VPRQDSAAASQIEVPSDRMILALFVKGLVIGFVIAAPVGPINIMCVRRTIVHGRLAGFASGLGAAIADTILGALAIFGMAFLTEFLISERFWLALGGAIFLVVLGIRALTKPPPKLVSARDPTSLIGDFTSTLLLTLSNPITILSFFGIFAAFGVHPDEMIGPDDWATLLGVFSGAMLWWMIVIGLAGMFRGRFTVTGLIWANRITGIVMLAFAAMVLVEVGRLWVAGS